MAALVSLIAVLIAGSVADSTGPPDHTLPDRAVDTPPTIDGQLREPAWAKARAATTFRQLEAEEGSDPSQRIEVHVLYG